MVLGEVNYAGRPISYWREVIKKPNPTWSDPPLSSPFRRNPDPDSIPLLLALMEDRDSDVRGLAAISLGYLGQRAKPAIPNLISTLRDPIPFVRRNVACALGRIGNGDTDAAVALRKALKDPDRRVRLISAQSLWIITGEPQPSVSILIEFLKSSGPEDDVSFVYKLLNHMGPSAADAISCLIDQLNHNEVIGRRALAAETLGRIGPAALDSISSLRIALRSTHDCVRIYAARSILQITKDGRESLPVIMLVAKSKDSAIYLRKIAIQSLGELRDRYPEADRVLLKIMLDPDKEIGDAAAAAIKK